ncbi:outer membrane protein assembly factor BamC [Shewanella algae]|uniref:outer membrane protein assembly factor BamC n=1 Tax=Shewanella algae TaxID=38313 RepID=UPI001AADFB77|nr:outer membrane protein assembly factor BamC [Shewanella algae]MBO2649672.1 outer membrane protein assembly factor BamC [Shewanella algae]
MLKQVSPLVLVVAVSACSTPIDRRQANGNFEYVEAGTSAPLVIPEGLDTPRFSKEFEIPQAGAKSNAEFVGEKLDIRPPLQVLPMAEGTHVEEGSDNIKVVVESIDNSVDLKQEIFSTVKGYLQKQGYGIVSEDYDKGSIETDWIETEQVLDSSWFGSDKVYQLRQRFRFDVEVRPHGRTGNLVINLIDHEEHYDGSELPVLLSGEDKRRYTIDMLNSAVAYMSLKREQMIKANRIKQSLGIDMSLHQGGDSESYWVADAPFKRTWDRLRIVLPELGLEVVDMDSSKGLFYVNLNDNSGFWSSLWGDNKLALKEGSYRLLLQESAANKEQTEIRLHDVADQPLANETVEAVYQNLADLMREDRKLR